MQHTSPTHLGSEIKQVIAGRFGPIAINGTISIFSVHCLYNLIIIVRGMFRLRNEHRKRSGVV